MMRSARALAGSIIWLATATFAFSEDQAGRQPCPDVTSETMGCELVAWSRLQEPIPLPEATEPPSREAKAREGVGGASKGRIPDGDSEDHRPLQCFAGVIVRNEGQYWLKVSPKVALPLSDGQIAQRHEGKLVKVMGVVDTEGKTLQIERVEPI
jgi:hypothetical protein